MIRSYIMLDYKKIASEFLRALRGPRSQLAFSKRLQYRSNVSYLWESQKKWPTAAKTFWAMQRIKLEPQKKIARFIKTPKIDHEPLSLGTPEGVASLLRDLRGNLSYSELSERTQKNRHAVTRWLKGNAEPRLPDLFCLIEAMTGRLVDFITALVEPSKMPTLYGHWKMLKAAREMMSDMPYSPAVLMALETVSYQKLKKYEQGWLSQKLGLSIKEEKDCLNVLQITKQIVWQKNKWKLNVVQNIDSRAIPAPGRPLKSWWTAKGLERIKSDKPGTFSFNVFTCSQADFEKIENMQIDYFRSVRALLTKSKPAERVAALNLHFFPLDEH